MACKNGQSAAAVVHIESGRDRNRDPQRKTSKARQLTRKRMLILSFIMIDHLPLLLILPIISMMTGHEYLTNTQGRRRHWWLP